MRRRVGLALGALALLIVVFALLIGRGSPTLPPLDELFRTGELRFAVDASNPPFALINAAGELDGMEIAIARAIAAEVRLPARLIPHGYDGLYDALRSGQVEAVIAALPVDPARLNEVNYSQPYFDAGLVLVSERITSMHELPDYTLAVEYGSISDAEARRWLRRVAAFTLTHHDSAQAALDAARTGTADAALVDAISARLYQREHGDWGVQVTLVQALPYAVITRAGEPAISVYIDNALTTLRVSGALDAIIGAWLE